MKGPVPLRPGDRVVLRKGHPCGANSWEIAGTGVEIKARCLQCGRFIHMSRSAFEKNISRLLTTEAQNGRQENAQGDGNN